MGFAARQAKELGADAVIVLAEGSEYAGTLTTGNAFTNGNFYPGGFNATTTGTRVSVPLMLGKAQVIAIEVAMTDPELLTNAMKRIRLGHIDATSFFGKSHVVLFNQKENKDYLMPGNPFFRLSSSV